MAQEIAISFIKKPPKTKKKTHKIKQISFSPIPPPQIKIQTLAK